MHRISHSELASYLTCPRKHHHAYRDRRVPRVASEALDTGRRVDMALKGDVVELSPLERALVDGHRIRWKASRIRETEQGVWFETQISNDVTIIGEFDAIGVDEEGREIIIERKTTSESFQSFLTRFVKLDPQVSTYLHARPSAQYVLVDMLKKSTLRGKKDETESQLHERALEAIANKLDEHYQRVQIVRFPNEHASHVRDVLGTVRLIQIGDEDASYGRLPPRNPKACNAYGRPCEYLPVCTNARSISDDLFYMNKEKRQ